jgi:hypothetical protein
MLQVASVGVARMGGNTMRSVATHKQVKIVAICDVDAKHMAMAAKDFPEASQHKDWRELLAKHVDKFDAITIGTPDHSHAGPCVTALRAKKHVYLQKPMAPTLHECRVITQEAVKAGMVTQLGMSEALGAIHYGAERPNPFGIGGASRDVTLSAATTDAIDAEVRRVLETAQGEARTLVRRHRGLLDRMASRLMENEVLEGRLLEAFLAEIAPRVVEPEPA